MFDVARGAGVRRFAGTPPFPGSAFPLTWYNSALADKRGGYDQDVTSPDINAQFSSNFNFYLGVDANHGAQLDLVAVLLHELGHGLGFQNFVNETNGSNLGNFFDGPRFYPLQTDVYSQFTLDITNNLIWSNMTDAQRAASAVRFGRVVWTGPAVTAAVPSVLSFGSPEVRVISPGAIAGAYQFGGAAFGAPISSPGITASVIEAVDAANVTGPTTTDGCTPFTNAAAVAGKIALIERGTCGFTVKVKNAQDAGAIGAIIYQNLANAGAAPPTMATDPVIGPTITITAVHLTRADGLGIIGQLGGGVTASIKVDLSIRAGADAAGRARLYAPFPVAPGSSISHFDTVSNRNQLMEPAINGDGVTDVNDQNQFSDIRPTAMIGSCNSGAPNNIAFPTGLTIQDRINALLATNPNHGQLVSGVNAIIQEAEALGLITKDQKKAIQQCAAHN